MSLLRIPLMIHGSSNMEMLLYYAGSCVVAMVVLSATFFHTGGKVDPYFMQRLLFLSVFWPALVLVFIVSLIFEKE